MAIEFITQDGADIVIEEDDIMGIIPHDNYFQVQLHSSFEPLRVKITDDALEFYQTFGMEEEADEAEESDLGN